MRNDDGALMRPETGRAVLAATARLAPGLDGPPLSHLVARIAATRGLTLTVEPASVLAAAPPRVAVGVAAGLVSGLRADRRPDRGVGDSCTADAAAGAGGVVLLAAHGGAGVSCLLRAGLAAAGGVDAGRCWPGAGSTVLMVTRTSTSGLEWARDLVRQHARGTAGVDVQLAGVILVADAPGRLPARIRALADLVCGAFVRSWQVPWLLEWRLAADTEPLPVHPEVARLIGAVRALSNPGPASGTTPIRSAHPTRSTTGGDVL